MRQLKPLKGYKYDNNAVAMALRLQFETNTGITCSCVHERYIYMKNDYSVLGVCCAKKVLVNT